MLKSYVKMLKPHAIRAISWILCLLLAVAPGVRASGDEVFHSLSAGIEWRVVDNTLVLSGQGVIPDFASAADLPWREESASIAAIVVGEGITAVGRNALSGCPNLLGIVLSSTLSTIDAEAIPADTPAVINAVRGSNACEWARDHGFSVVAASDRPIDEAQAFAANTLPLDGYIALAVRTIDGASYYPAVLIRECDGFSASTIAGGTMFYLDEELRVVNDGATLSKLLLMDQYDGERIVANIAGMARANARITAMAIELNDEEALMAALGSAGAALISAAWGKIDLFYSFFADGAINLEEAIALSYTKLLKRIVEDAERASQDALALKEAMDGKANLEYDDCLNMIMRYGEAVYYASLAKRLCMPVINQITSEYGSDFEVALRRNLWGMIKSIGKTLYAEASTYGLKGLLTCVFANFPTAQSADDLLKIAQGTYALVEYALGEPLEVLFTLSDGVAEVTDAQARKELQDDVYLAEVNLAVADAQNAAKPYLSDLHETDLLLNSMSLRAWTLSGGLFDRIGNLSESVIWYLQNGALVVSGIGAMPDFAGLDDQPWADLRGEIAAVTIESGVTCIGDYAFEGCAALTDVFIADGVAGIGQCAFRDCASLGSVAIGRGVTSVEAGAFADCDELSSVAFPDDIRYIGRAAFSGCRALTDVFVPPDVEAIDDAAFSQSCALSVCNGSYPMLWAVYNRVPYVVVEDAPGRASAFAPETSDLYGMWRCYYKGEYQIDVEFFSAGVVTYSDEYMGRSAFVGEYALSGPFLCLKAESLRMYLDDFDATIHVSVLMALAGEERVDADALGMFECAERIVFPNDDIMLLKADAPNLDEFLFSNSGTGYAEAAFRGTYDAALAQLLLRLDLSIYANGEPERTLLAALDNPSLAFFGGRNDGGLRWYCAELSGADLKGEARRILSDMDTIYRGMAAYSPNENVVTVLFQGSQGVNGWANNFDCSNSGGVHKSFCETVSAFAPEFLRARFPTASGEEQTVQSLLASGAKLVVSGHSQGGALCQVLQWYLVENGYVDIKDVCSYTFAAPVAFDKPRKEYTAYNVVNRMDLVPHVGLCVSTEPEEMTRLIRYGTRLANVVALIYFTDGFSLDDQVVGTGYLLNSLDGIVEWGKELEAGDTFDLACKDLAGSSQAGADLKRFLKKVIGMLEGVSVGSFEGTEALIRALCKLTSLKAEIMELIEDIYPKILAHTLTAYRLGTDFFVSFAPSAQDADIFARIGYCHDAESYLNEGLAQVVVP